MQTPAIDNEEKFVAMLGPLWCRSRHYFFTSEPFEFRVTLNVQADFKSNVFLNIDPSIYFRVVLNHPVSTFFKSDWILASGLNDEYLVESFCVDPYTFLKKLPEIDHKDQVKTIQD